MQKHEIAEEKPVFGIRKKILVLISEGGGGHKTAGESIREIFCSEYDVDIVNVLTDIVRPIDWLNRITSGGFTSEDLYNFMLRKGYHKGMRLLFTGFGTRYMYANQAKIEKLFEQYLEHAPFSYDLVISTTPFVNGGLAKTLQKRDIPFIVLPTDLETSTFFVGMKPEQFHDRDKIAFAISYDDEDIKKKIFGHSGIPPDKIVFTGFPVRENCRKRYGEGAVALLRLKHGFSNNRLALTLLLGASGNQKLLTYAEELSRLRNEDFSKPLEISICLGKNEKMGKLIIDRLLQKGGGIIKETPAFVTIRDSKDVFFHVRKFTKDIIEIMACSDLLITKTGSCSVNEGIYLGKKLLLDNTSDSSGRHLFWETFNLQFVRKHGLGDVFSDISEMNPLIRQLIREETDHPVLSGVFQPPDFGQNIAVLVKKFLS